jgi:hypothetical protein
MSKHNRASVAGCASARRCALRSSWPTDAGAANQHWRGRLCDVVRCDNLNHKFAKRRPFVLLEFHRDKKLRFGKSRADVVQVLFDAGYEALFFTDHQIKAGCQIVQVEASSHYFARQETDLLLFVHPDYLAGRSDHIE